VAAFIQDMNVVAVIGFRESHIYLTDRPVGGRTVSPPPILGGGFTRSATTPATIWHSEPAYRAERRRRDARPVLDGGQLRPRERVAERPVGLPVEDRDHLWAG
jgi:hypothetical protein